MGGVLMYKLGTLKQFELEDQEAKKAAGWTSEEIKNGKVTVIEDEGETYENKQTQVLAKRQNPNGSDEYLWESISGDIKDPFNIKSSWKKQIKGHKFAKYYVAQKSICSVSNSGEKDCYLYREVKVGQVVSFGSNVCSIEIFDTEAQYLGRLKELDIAMEEAI
jgi:hypothetical protein